MLKHEGQTYYLRQQLTSENFSPLVGKHAFSSLHTIFAIGGVTIIALCVLAFLLCKKIVRPGSALSQWAANLDEHSLRTTPPNFYYPELNKLASLIRNSLLSVRQSLDREQLFFRYSSHELRTPITVILNSVELLQKIKESTNGHREEQEKSVVQRIERAGQTMQHLVETLLWLGRDATTHLPASSVDIELLLKEVVQESNYLLLHKHIDLVLDTQSTKLYVPETACRIVLANLVRNAFVHIRRGLIHIIQRDAQIEVINYMAEEDDISKDIGFGLG